MKTLYPCLNRKWFARIVSVEIWTRLGRDLPAVIGANAGRQHITKRFPFELVFADKRANSSGLQLADLVARPVGMSVLRPGQPNRAFAILESKLYASPDGRIDGYGLKIFP